MTWPIKVIPVWDVGEWEIFYYKKNKWALKKILHNENKLFQQDYI